MPRKNIVERQSTWVPLVARVLCYHCGVALATDIDKNHCRMCGDIFCLNCWGTLVQLSPEYGYGAIPQPVCVTCSLVLSSFPAFTARLHQQGGGQLLPPQHAVIVVADTRTNGVASGGGSGGSGGGDAAAGGGGASNPKSPGLFARIFSSSAGDSAKEAKEAQRASISSTAAARGSVAHRGSVMNPGAPGDRNSRSDALAQAIAPHQRFPLDPEFASPLCLYGWRPLNPSTMISCQARGGVVNIPLKLIRGVEYHNNEKVLLTVVDEGAMGDLDEVGAGSSGGAGGAASSSNGGGGGARGGGGGSMTLPLAVVHLVVGTVEEEYEEGSQGAAPHAVRSFTFDAVSSQNLVASLNSLLRHTKAHFAFSQAALALHPDLCPGPRKP